MLTNIRFFHTLINILVNDKTKFQQFIKIGNTKIQFKGSKI